MSVFTAELFTPDNATHYAEEAVALVARDDLAEYLAEARPVTLENFASGTAAVEAITRVINARTITGGPLCRGSNMVGVWTRTSSIPVKDPRYPYTPFAKMHGYNLDYWGYGLTSSEHGLAFAAVAARMQGRKYYSMLTVAETAMSLGIPGNMVPIGERDRAALTLIRGLLLSKDYGLRKIPDLQFYKSR